MTYFSTGAAHAPHQPPLDWRGRNAGRFDMGWDAYREQVHANQLRMGIVPEGTRLTDRPEQIPSWDSQPPEHQALFARQAENFADFLNAIRTGSKPVSDIGEVHLATNMALLGMISLKLGRSLEWDGAKEHIVGDDAANKLLRRQYRKGWEYPKA